MRLEDEFDASGLSEGFVERIDFITRLHWDVESHAGVLAFRALSHRMLCGGEGASEHFVDRFEHRRKESVAGHANGFERENTREIKKFGEALLL